MKTVKFLTAMALVAATALQGLEGIPQNPEIQPIEKQAQQTPGLDDKKMNSPEQNSQDTKSVSQQQAVQNQQQQATQNNQQQTEERITADVQADDSAMPTEIVQAEVKPVTGDHAIIENRDGGKMLAFDNGISFEVPTILKKKSVTWQIGEKVTIEKTKKEGWYRLFNQTRNEKIRAKQKV